VTRLKDVATLIAGQSPPSDQVSALTGGLPFLQGNAEFGTKVPTAVQECDSAPKRCRAGDILLSVRAPVGAVNVADREYGIGRGLCAVRPRAIDGGYLWWWLQHCKSELDSLATGSTFEAVTASTIGGLRLPDVGLADQGRIASWLDEETATIDDLVRRQEALIRIITERRTALIAHLTLGSCTAWTGKLGRVLKKLDRGVCPGTGVVTAYRDGQVTLRSRRRADGYTISETESGYQGVEEGDLVFHALDGFAGAVGISDTSGKCSPVYHVCRGTAEVYLPYLAYHLRALGNAGFLTAYAWSVRQRSVDYRNWKLFASLPVALPSYLDQQRIVAQLDTHLSRSDVLINKTSGFIALAKERRSALITAAVTCQLDGVQLGLEGAA
jgi:type I restriction enzyme S subunit